VGRYHRGFTPIVIMAAYCTLVGGVYLAMAPVGYRALCNISTTLNNRVSRIDDKPDMDVWKHKDEFYMYEAACLLDDIRPTSAIQDGSNAAAWYGALTTAPDKGEIKRVESVRDNYYYFDYGKYNPHAQTMISKEELKRFTEKRGQRPRFLFMD